MRLLVLSDSHGRVGIIQDIIKKEKFDKIIFLGDGIRDFDYIENDNILKVVGNCDFFVGTEPKEIRIILEGVKTLITHGNLYKVKLGLESIIKEAKNGLFGLALFGHTHVQQHIEIDGLHLVNPGSVYNGKYALIKIEEGNICEVVLKSL